MITLIKFTDGHIEHWSGCMPCPMFDEETIDMCDKDGGVQSNPIPMADIETLTFNPQHDDGGFVGMSQHYER